jgi:hypothetical protein
LIDTGFAGFDGRDAGRIVEAARTCRHHADRLPSAHALPLGSRRGSGGARPAAADSDFYRRPRSGSESSGDVGKGMAGHPRAV